MTDEELIARLELCPHVEGGFYRQTYRAGWSVELDDRPGRERLGMTSIFYLLNRRSPIGYFHRNRSDIFHCFQLGSPLVYLALDSAGRLTRHTLGPDVSRGHLLQLVIPGGTWKATFLAEGAFGLVSEIVAPGYDDRDCEIASREQMQASFPHLWPSIERFVAPVAPTAREARDGD